MNEVEKLFVLLNKMIHSKIGANPKGGVKIDDTCKMRYSDMANALKSLETFVLDWNEIRCFNICKECSYFNNGRCQAKDRDIKNAVNPYHTCWRNTSSRWNKDNKSFEY